MTSRVTTLEGLAGISPGTDLAADGTTVRSTRYWGRPGEAIRTWTAAANATAQAATPLTVGGAYSITTDGPGKGPALRITGNAYATSIAKTHLDDGEIVEFTFRIARRVDNTGTNAAANNVPVLELRSYKPDGTDNGTAALPATTLLAADGLRTVTYRACLTPGVGSVDLPANTRFISPLFGERGTGAVELTSCDRKTQDPAVTALDLRTADLPATFITDSDVYDEENKRVVYAAVGSEGRGAHYITEDGSVVTGRTSQELVDLEDTSIAYAEVDKNFRPIRIVYLDGSVSYPGGVRGFSSGGGGGGTTIAARGPQVAPSLKYRLLYGQSLATGTAGLPLLSTTPLYDTLMFTGGIRLLANPDMTSFTNAVETQDSALGETGAVASAHHSSTYLAALTGLTPTTLGSNYFVASGGRGGATLARLAKGSGYYTNMLTIASSAMPIAVASGRTFGMSVIEFIHGQADYAFGTSRLSYANGLVQFRKDLEADTKAQTGQSGIIPMLVSQAGCQAAYYLRMSSDAPTQRAYPDAPATPEIDMAMMDAAAADPNTIVHMSLYCTGDLDGGDGIHRGSEDYRMIGRNRGRAAAKIEKALADGTPFPEVAVRPLSYIAQKRSIRIKMSVPYGPLVFDTSWVLPTFNNGFDIWDAGGASPVLANIIQSVAIVGKDTIEIKLNADLPATWLCSYAWGRNVSADGGRSKGARGNLRDSEGDSPTGSNNTYVDNSGVTRRLDNYCLLFALTNKV
ncbi:hypothetical protein ASF34_01075 [Methylobacterium sp. Leaf106]|nr:hypothetical protein ASF34_01075 [Methylobacterium sp. Leaf106]